MSLATELFGVSTDIDATLELYGTQLVTVQPVPDAILNLQDPLQNPPLQQRCGQNIAVVFDLSSSITRTPTGLSSIVDAGTAAINSLAGTQTKMGLYNFGTSASTVPVAEVRTPLSLSDPKNVTTLKNSIQTLNTYNPNATQGTNWEAALKSVLAAEQSGGFVYDAVYFVTDGLPTNSSQGMPYGASPNFVTDATDLDTAIAAANNVKALGTHITTVPIGVGGTEYLLKGTYPSLKAAQADNWSRGNYYLENGNSDQNVYDLIKSGKAWVKNRSGAIEPDSAKWSEGAYSSTQIIQSMMGPNQVDGGFDIASTDLTNFMKNLRTAVASTCAGKLIVNKTIVDVNGNVLMPGEGWRFDATAIDAVNSPQQNIVYTDVDGKSTRTDKRSQMTDARGQVIFNIDSTTDQKISVNEVIPEGSGYALFKQHGENAVCNIISEDPNTGVMSKTPVSVVSDAAGVGFSVILPYDKTMASVRNVECDVRNQEKPQEAMLKITKVAYDSDATKDNYVIIDGSNAEFVVYPDKEGKPDYAGVPLLTLKAGETAAKGLEAGTYWLVESRSPAGYQLLPSPVRFQITPTGEAWTTTIQNDGTLVFEDDVNKPTNEIWLKVADIKTGKLPKAGGNGVFVYLLLAVSLIGVGALYARRRA
ncbi:SpaA isopeptide-forming pilin-related protein [Corynebacterium sp. H127]|uniref:SpaA isopeptide-forming pilin-related protein n=1 Tax=Corynebacterium sp. H127 TaxID=3133418 RepID=UPI0030A1D7EC